MSPHEIIDTTMLESIPMAIGRSDRCNARDSRSMHAHSSASKASLHDHSALQAEKMMEPILCRRIILAPALELDTKEPSVFSLTQSGTGGTQANSFSGAATLGCL